MKKEYIRPVTEEMAMSGTSLLTNSIFIDNDNRDDPSNALIDDRQWGDLW